MNYGIIADIGGTNVRFALVDQDQNLRSIQEMSVSVYNNFEDALRTYMNKTNSTQEIRNVMIDVACPVMGDQIELTNAHWRFSISQIQEDFNLASFDVVNDFGAIALSLPFLTEKELLSMNGNPPQDRSVKLAVGPGTGLGVAILAPNGDDWILLPSEGGHTTIAAENDEETEILKYLRRKYQGHVSAERVVSGHGIRNLYEALFYILGYDHQSTFQPLHAHEISSRAIEEQDELCIRVLKQFCAFFGSVAGSLSLATLARGGVYIAGGIIPKIEAIFRESDFISRFESKGRMRELTSTLPVYLITSPYPAFPGMAASVAKRIRMASETLIRS